MTAYANLRNALATIATTYTTDCHDFDENATAEQFDAFYAAQFDLEDHLFATCRTSSDFDHVFERYTRMVERAARTASHNEQFVAAVMRYTDERLNEPVLAY